MLLYDIEADSAFNATFDCRFPYHDDAAAKDLIRRGWTISFNAACCVLEEVCRPPRSAKVGKERLRALVREWAGGGTHPMQSALLLCAAALIDGPKLPLAEGLAIMDRIGEHDGQYAALSIACFACDTEAPGTDLKVEAADAAVRRRWRLQNLKGRRLM